MDRVGNLEKQVEEMKTELEKVTEMEKMMEIVIQGLARILSDVEDAKRKVQSTGNKIPAEKDNLNVDPSKKTLEEGDKAQEQKNVGMEGRVIIPQSTKSTEKHKGKTKVRTKSDVVAELINPDQPFIRLPSFPDFGLKGKLMKLKGKIKNKEVVVLIKTDTTHNFLAEKVMEELCLPFTETIDYFILMEDKIVKGHGVCMSVTLELVGITAAEHFFPLQMAKDVDVILGSKWFHSVGDVTIYHQDGLCKMKLKKGKCAIEWIADPNL